MNIRRMGTALLALGLALPALADVRFQVRRMTRDDVPRGKGQCDIRLQVDDQVVAHRGRDPAQQRVARRFRLGRSLRGDCGCGHAAARYSRLAACVHRCTPRRAPRA